MRERLVAAFVTLTVLVVVVFAFARSYSTAAMVEGEEMGKVATKATLVATVVGLREAHHEPVTSQYLTRLLGVHERIVYRGPDQKTRLDAVSPGDTAKELDGSANSVSRSHPVTGGGVVTVQRSASMVQDRVSEAVLQIVVLGAVLALLAAVAGWIAAGRLARPFRTLAGIADEFGRGRFDVEIPHFSVPEAEEIGLAMSGAAAEVRELVARERQFSVNASHQLRTPITALRLELEDLSLWPETSEPVRAELGHALGELDRLNAAVTELLTSSRRRKLSEIVAFDLSALIHDTVSRWQPEAKTRLRRIETDDGGPVPVQLPPGPIAQVLDVLIENALVHGQGTVQVTTASPDGYLQVQVRDQGERTIGVDVFHGDVGPSPEASRSVEATGLPGALETAEALGGHLRVEPDPQTTFSLMLPKPSSDPAE